MEKNIAQHIEPNASKITCQHYVLWPRSYELHSGGWIPRVVVPVPVKAGNGDELPWRSGYVYSRSDERAHC
jgi:hypothetical protein